MARQTEQKAQASPTFAIGDWVKWVSQSAGSRVAGVAAAGEGAITRAT